MRSFICLTALLATSLFLGGCVQNSPMSAIFAPGKEAVAKAQVATVADFAESYGQNSAKANSDYRGKWVKIRGIVTDVRKIKAMPGTGSTDFYYVGLKDHTNKTKEIMTARFNFNKRTEVESLKAGNTVTLLGQVAEVDSVVPLPVITDCSIVE